MIESNYGLRRRKNCELFVAGMATDLLAPSSRMGALLVSQFAGGISVVACSKPKSAVFADGQEIVRSRSERETESDGRGSKNARAM